MPAVPSLTALGFCCLASIDQLDKVEPPALPETYLYLLSLQCFNIIVEGFASAVTPVYSSIVPLRSSLETAKDQGRIEEQQRGSADAATTRDMVEAGWPAILAALSFFIGRNLSEEVRSAALPPASQSKVYADISIQL